MTWVAVAIAGGAVVGAGASIIGGNNQADAAKSAAQIQADASTKAAQIQADAATRAASTEAAQNQKGIDFAKGIYDQNAANSKPYIDAGSSAIGSMQGILNKGAPSLSDLQMDPGYGWRLSQGLDALQASAAARGGLLSGNTLTGINNYAQGSASQEYQNAFGRYMDKRGQDLNGYNQIAGYGTNALSSLNGAGSAMGQTGAQLYGNTGAAMAGGITGAGNAQAAGTVGAANAQAAGNVGAAGAYASGYGNAANALTQGASSYGNYQQSTNLLAALSKKAPEPAPSPTLAPAPVQPVAQPVAAPVAPYYQRPVPYYGY